MPDTLTIQSIRAQLAAEIETLCGLPAGTVNEQTSLPTLGIDSLKFVSLLLAIEQKFGVSLMKIGIKKEWLATIVTLSDAIQAGRTV